MEYIPLAALVLSAIAIVISVLSLGTSRRALRSSEDAQHHTRLVAYEQRRQEVRQVFVDGISIVRESTAQWNHAIEIAEDIIVKEKISEGLKVTLLEATKNVRGGIARNNVTRNEYEKVLQELDQIPSSPSTQERIDLEKLGGTGIRLKNEVQASFDKVRGSVQRLDETIKNIRDKRSIPK